MVRHFVRRLFLLVDDVLLLLSQLHSDANYLLLVADAQLPLALRREVELLFLSNVNPKQLLVMLMSQLFISLRIRSISIFIFNVCSLSCRTDGDSISGS